MLAREHSVKPLICSVLLRRGVSEVPAVILDRLHQDLREMARLNLLFSNELMRILNLLETAGIDARVFKGPILAEMLRHHCDAVVL